MPVFSDTDGINNNYTKSKILHFAFELIKEDSLKDFQIWLDDLKFGLFNNILIQTTSKNRSEEIFAFQLVHPSENEAFSLRSLEDEFGKYSFSKYFESYLHCRHNLSSENVKYIMCSDEDFQHFGREGAEISFSYKKEEVRLILEKCTDFLPFNRQSKDVGYKLRLKSDWLRSMSRNKDNEEDTSQMGDLKDFLKSFYLIGGQSNMFDTHRKNYEDFKGYYDTSDEKEVAQKFTSFMESFHNEKNESMNKEHFVLKLLHILLTDSDKFTYEQNALSSNTDDTGIQELLIEAFNLFDVNVTAKSTKTKKEILAKPSGTKTEIFETLLKNKRLPLTVNTVDKSNVLIIRIINLCKSINIPVIIDKDVAETGKDIKKFKTLKDLLVEDFKMFSRLTNKLSLRVSGRIVPLKYFLQNDKELCELITIDHIFLSLHRSESQQDFTILPKHCHYFSSSLMKNIHGIEDLQVTRIVIDIKFITNTNSKFLSIINCGDQLENFQKELVRSSRAAQQIYLYRSNCTDDDFEQIVRQNPDTAHHLFDLVKLNEKFYLEWRRSTKEIQNLQPFRHYNFFTNAKVLSNSKSINIICYDSAKEKNAYLKLLKATVHSKYFVQEINHPIISKLSNVDNLLHNVLRRENNKFHSNFLNLLKEEKRIIFVWTIENISEDLLVQMLDVIDEINKLGFPQWLLADSRNQTNIEERFVILAWKLQQSETRSSKIIGEQAIPHNSMHAEAKPLHWQSIRKGYEEIAQYLAIDDAALKTNRKIDENRLIFAAEQGNVEEFTKLLKSRQKLYPNLLLEQGPLLLFTAIQSNRLEIVEILIMNDVNVICVDQDGYTPLAVAVKKGYFEIVKYLTIYKADINKISRDGSTPLLLATENEHKNIEAYLIRKGAIISSEK